MERIGVRRGIGAAPRRARSASSWSPRCSRFAGQQVATGANDLATQVSDGLGEIKDWLRTGPLHVSDRRSTTTSRRPRTTCPRPGPERRLLSQVTNIGSALAHVLAGLFLVLFSTYFFLADGDRIWAWIVRLSSRAPRGRASTARAGSRGSR